MASGESKLEEISHQFQRLSETAALVNKNSDELTILVASLDEPLKKLNIGLSVWVGFASWSDEYRAAEDQIGYSKVNGKWCIALRRIWDDGSFGEAEDGPWAFNDAPREMRLNGVDKIPELFEALNDEASGLAKKIQDSTEKVRKIASAITASTREQSGRKLAKVGDVFASGLSPEQLRLVLAGVKSQHQFIGEVLEQSSRCELVNDEFRIYFATPRLNIAELMKGKNSIAAVASVAKKVLGREVNVVVRVQGTVAALSDLVVPDEDGGAK